MSGAIDRCIFPNPEKRSYLLTKDSNAARYNVNVTDSTVNGDAELRRLERPRLSGTIPLREPTNSFGSTVTTELGSCMTALRAAYRTLRIYI